MNDEEYALEISKKEGELQGFTKELEELKDSLIEDIGKFAQVWQEEFTNSQIKQNSRNTIELGKDKLSVLKRRLGELKENFPSIVKERLSRTGLWWHEDYEHKAENYFFSGKVKDEITKETRFILGRLGPLLEEFGYIPQEHHDRWIEYGERGFSTEQEVYYPFRLELPNPIEEVLKEYSEKFSEASTLFEKLCRLKKERAETQAENIWKSA